MTRRVAWALLVAAAVVNAPPARAADLLAVVMQAVDRDADLAQAGDDAAIARFAVSEARGSLLPRVDVGWARAYNQISVDGYPRVTYWQSGWTVQLTQPLFDWSRWVEYRKAGAADEGGRLRVAERMQTAILQASAAYFDELAAEDELARASAYAAAVADQQALTTRLRTAREATAIDQREVDALLDAAQLEQADARDKVQTQRRVLERLTGRPFASTPPREAGRLRFALPCIVPDDPQPWIDQARAMNYRVQSAQIDVHKADLDVEAARAQRYPVVNLNADVTPAGAAGGYSRPSTTAVAMLSIVVPLYRGGEINARVGKARAGRDKADHALLAAVRAAESSAADGYARVDRGRARVERLAKLADANRARLDATRIGFRTGSRTNMDVLRAIDALYAGQRDLLRAHYDTMKAFLELKASTATLGLDDIAAMNARIGTMPGFSGPVAGGESAAVVGARDAKR